MVSLILKALFVLAGIWAAEAVLFLLSYRKSARAEGAPTVGGSPADAL